MLSATSERHHHDCSSEHHAVHAPGSQPGAGVGASHRGRGDGRRPLGGSRRQGGRGRRRCRRDAPTRLLGVDAWCRRDRRGREGRSADALQRRGGRQRAGPGLRLRRRPRRRNHVDGQGHAERHLGAGGGRARRDVRPLSGVLHGQDRRRTGRRRRDRHRRPSVGEPPQGGQGEEVLDIRSDRAASWTVRATPN